MDDILISDAIVATPDGWLNAVNLLIQNGHIAAIGSAQSQELSLTTDTQDCFENMKMALCLARASGFDAAALSPRQVLGMATASHGLKVGQPADLSTARLDSVWSAPVHDLGPALDYVPAQPMWKPSW